MARILFTCFGSLGDLFPYLAVAKVLQARGHDVAVGTSSLWAPYVEAESLRFVHLRCALDRYVTPELARQLLERLFHPARGGQTIVDEMMLGIGETYLDTRAALADADVVVSNPLAYATPISCRESGVPWLSTVLAPMFFMSTEDPPPMEPLRWLPKLHRISPALYRGVFALIKRSSLGWAKPLYQMCRQHGLATPEQHPLFDGQYSPHGTLAMFPAGFAAPQADWPPHTSVTGFPYFTPDAGEDAITGPLETFLDAGAPPIVFALGSSAVNIAGDFFAVSAKIARLLGQRAVLVHGPHADQIKDIPPGDDILAIPYVSYGKLFDRASVVVHQGGIGTLAQAMRALRPMLVVPFGFDQFDNGQRIERLGLGRTLLRTHYSVEKALPVIRDLLTRPEYRQRAETIGREMAREDGTARAADMVEELTARSRLAKLDAN
ncbi:MAG TPA: glycosyltransferase [Magnetospirillum sp.]|nr:glycosyltransferase [Magnetospirillum sp.]